MCVCACFCASAIFSDTSVSVHSLRAHSLCLCLLNRSICLQQCQPKFLQLLIVNFSNFPTENNQSASHCCYIDSNKSLLVWSTNYFAYIIDFAFNTFCDSFKIKLLTHAMVTPRKWWTEIKARMDNFSEASQSPQKG